MVNIFNKIDSWAKKRTDTVLDIPVIFVSDDYDEDSDFFEMYQDNIKLAKNKVMPRLGYIVVAIEATPDQLGAVPLNSDDKKRRSTPMRIYTVLTEDQADKLLTFSFHMSLQTFVAVFSNSIKGSPMTTPKDELNIIVPRVDADGDMIDGIIVALSKIKTTTDLIQDANRLYDLGQAKSLRETLSDKAAEAFDDARDSIIQEISAEDLEKIENADAPADEPTERDEPMIIRFGSQEKNVDEGAYSNDVLKRMYNNVKAENEVPDTAVNFIIAMVHDMSEKQKDRLFSAISDEWLDLNSTRAAAMLMRIGDLASDVPNAVKRYKDNLENVFPDDDLPREVKAQMVAQFHAGLVQKVI